MVFSKFLQLLGKSREKSIAEQISGETQLSDDLREQINQLPLESKIELLEAGEQIFNTESWDQFIQQLVHQGFTQQLLQQLKSNSSALKVEAVGVLTKFPAEAVIDDLMELLAFKNEAIRFEATSALIQLNHPLVVQELIKVLNQPKKWIPARVMEIFSSYRELAVPELIKAFDQGDRDMRLRIAEMLTKLPHSAAEVLFRRCLEEADASLRGIGMIGLGELGKGQELLPNLIKAQDVSLRLKALQIMEQAQDPAIYNYYWIALKDENWLVRTKAAETLIERGLLPPEALDRIRASNDNPDLLTEIFEMAGELNQEAFIWKR